MAQQRGPMLSGALNRRGNLSEAEPPCGLDTTVRKQPGGAPSVCGLEIRSISASRQGVAQSPVTY
jgi:hypothetical protein